MPVVKCLIHKEEDLTGTDVMLFMRIPRGVFGLLRDELKEEGVL